MSKLIATLVASLFAAAAFAQSTPGLPPSQPAAGTTASTGVPKTTTASDKPVSEKKAARIAKAKARKAKREAKVGDKPAN
jgi:hypothetical protein